MTSARQRLLVGGIIVALALLAGVTWAAWRQFERIDAATRLVSHTEQVLNQLTRLLSLIQDVESGARGFLVAGDPAFLEPYETARRRIPDELEELCRLVDDTASQRANCAELSPLVHLRIASSQNVVELRRRDGFDAAQQAVSHGGGRVLMDRIRGLIRRMDADERTLLAERTAEAKAAARISYLRMTTTIGGALVLWLAALAAGIRENRLRHESDRRYHQLFSSIDEGFCIIEMIFDEAQRPVDYRFLEINPAFERQTGIQDALGRRMREIAPKHEEHWFEIYGRIALTGESARFQNEARELRRWYDVYAFRFGAPHLRQVAILFNDITQRKAAEAELAHANRELESFAYSVSHDLRAPLRSIDGFSQIVLEENADQLNDDGRHHLSRVRKATKTMGELIDALLELSRVSRIELKTETVDLSAIAQTIATELRESRPDRQAEFIIEPDLKIEADRRLFRALLANLLENAWKYSSDRPVARIEFGLTHRDHEAVFFVRDNGIGFDMAYASKLFGAFERLHGQDEYAGTGIGLATVRRILDRHNGRAWAEARHGEGATFYFTVGRMSPAAR